MIRAPVTAPASATHVGVVVREPALEAVAGGLVGVAGADAVCEEGEAGQDQHEGETLDDIRALS